MKIIDWISRRIYVRPIDASVWRGGGHRARRRRLPHRRRSLRQRLWWTGSIDASWAVECSALWTVSIIPTTFVTTFFSGIASTTYGPLQVIFNDEFIDYFKFNYSLLLNRYFKFHYLLFLIVLLIIFNLISNYF